jgi:hypothetical protein
MPIWGLVRHPPLVYQCLTAYPCFLYCLSSGGGVRQARGTTRGQIGAFLQSLPQSEPMMPRDLQAELAHKLSPPSSPSFLPSLPPPSLPLSHPLLSFHHLSLSLTLSLCSYGSELVCGRSPHFSRIRVGRAHSTCPGAYRSLTRPAPRALSSPKRKQMALLCSNPAWRLVPAPSPCPINTKSKHFSKHV